MNAAPMVAPAISLKPRAWEMMLPIIAGTSVMFSSSTLTPTTM